MNPFSKIIDEQPRLSDPFSKATDVDGIVDHEAGIVDHKAGIVDHKAGTVEHREVIVDHQAGIAHEKTQTLNHFLDAKVEI